MIDTRDKNVWMIGRLDQSVALAQHLTERGRLSRWDSFLRFEETDWLAHLPFLRSNRVVSRELKNIPGHHVLPELIWQPFMALAGWHAFRFNLAKDVTLDLLAYFNEPNDYQILHGQTGYCLFSGRRALLSGKTFVHDIMSQLPHRRRIQLSDEYRAHGLSYVDRGERVLKRTIATALIADAVLVPSLSVREAAIEVGVSKDRLHVVPYDSPLGLRILRQCRPIRSRDAHIRLLYVGALNIEKGIAHLHAAFDNLTHRYPGLFELHMAGRPDALGNSYLSRMPPGAVHHGVLSVKDLEKLYLTSDIFVFPSLSEGYSLALIEAQSAGLPAIVTVDAQGPVIDNETGIIVPPRDPDAIVRAVEDLAADEEKRSSFSHNARENMAQAGRSLYGQKVEKIYEIAINRKVKGGDFRFQP